MTLDLLLFGIVGAVAIASSLVVILHRNPVYCALALVVALFQVAALFVLLGAHMIAFLQIIVYAGAIMVLFLFVIMLLNPGQDVARPPAAARAIALGAGGALAGEMVFVFLARPLSPTGREAAEDFGSVVTLGRALFGTHVFSFELTSILLLVAVVGAVVIARRGERE